MKVFVLLISYLFIYSFSFSNLIDKHLYENLNEPNLNKQVLNIALEGLAKTDVKNKNIITIIDYTKSANEKRMFVIDLKKEKVLFSTYVAHGKNSGGEFAQNFSNTVNSKKSSIGFFKTSKPYRGIHGYSLRIDGLEKGINDNAYKRNIVIHGATYVNEKYIQRNGRLGRSWGCPAIPFNLTKDVINTIKNGTLIYINGNLQSYKKRTKYAIL